MITRHPFLFALCSALLATVTLNCVADEPDAPTNEVRVMSFNIRYGTAKDGDNQWENRKSLVATTIREFQPDLLGTQETFKFQADFLREQFPEFTGFGRTREEVDGDEGEQCTLFYRTERFTKLGAGHLWLSETPNVPGSKSWDSSLPRMVTWLCLRDKQRPDLPVCIFNTHFDHRGPTAREEAAKLIAQRSRSIAQSHGNALVIVTGDFNTDEGSAPYQSLITDADDSLVDTYRATHEEVSEVEGTFNGFQGTDDRARIDWVLVDPRWKIQSSAIVRRNEDGRYPSDHFPVTAVLNLPE